MCHKSLLIKIVYNHTLTLILSSDDAEILNHTITEEYLHADPDVGRQGA